MKYALAALACFFASSQVMAQTPPVKPERGSEQAKIGGGKNLNVIQEQRSGTVLENANQGPVEAKASSSAKSTTKASKPKKSGSHSKR
jgi:hypothetical protein